MILCLILHVNTDFSHSDISLLMYKMPSVSEGESPDFTPVALYLNPTGDLLKDFHIGSLNALAMDSSPSNTCQNTELHLTGGQI